MDDLRLCDSDKQIHLQLRLICLAGPVYDFALFRILNIFHNHRLIKRNVSATTSDHNRILWRVRENNHGLLLMAIRIHYDAILLQLIPLSHADHRRLTARNDLGLGLLEDFLDRHARGEFGEFEAFLGIVELEDAQVGDDHVDAVLAGQG